MQCPKCTQAMTAVTYDETTVDRCTDCGGIWFDAHERETLLTARGGVRAVDTGDPTVGQRMNERDRISCPRCTTQMVRMVDQDRPDIRYEQCAVCGGSFLDAGELLDLNRMTLSRILQNLLSV